MDLIPGRRQLPPQVKEEWERAGARTRLAAARRSEGIRQQDLAAAIGVSTATLREIEAGRVGPGVSIGVLLAAAAVLGYPVSALVEDQWLETAEKLAGSAPTHRKRIPVQGPLTPPPP